MPELNNNRGNNNNNRRRGRGNNNRPQNGGGGGGGQQINRIDSRARGNAPQMLEKYRKMAQDAHLNGDRVQAEYYLQFADHYFRVVADTRVRLEEQQRQRQNGGQPYTPGYTSGGSVSGDNWQEDGDDDAMEFGADRDFPSFERAPQQPQAQPSQRDNQRDNQRDQGREQGRDQPREQREYREPRQDRDSRYRAPEPAAEAQAGEGNAAEGPRVVEGEPITANTDNPFVRDARGPRGRNNDHRGARRADNDAPRPPRNFAEPVAEVASSAPRFDPSSLPPAIGVRSEVVEAAPARVERPRTLRAATAAPAPVAVEAEPAVVETGEAPAAPRKRGRPRKNPLPLLEG